jgi:hypothetical protein
MMLNKDQAKDAEDEAKEGEDKPEVIDGSLPVAVESD